MQLQRPVQFNEDVILIGHSKDAHQLRLLIHFSAIIENQLPLMPYYHITNLLFDQKHQNLIALKNQEVIGGVCFIVWQQKMLCELSLMALNCNHQEKGHGTALVNHLKNLLQKLKINAIVTNADNNALEFYKKQGFTQSQILCPQTYQSPINYSNSTLMSFKINTNTNYLLYSLAMTNQVKFVKQRLKRASNYKKYQLDISNILKSHSYKKKGKQYQYQINPVFIEGLIENGWSQKELEQMNESKEMEQCQLKKRQRTVLKRLQDIALPYVKEFPKELELSPFYQHPTDLKTIEIKLEENTYSTNMEFQNDIKLVFSNCSKLYSSNNALVTNVQKLTQLLSEIKNQIQQ